MNQIPKRFLQVTILLLLMAIPLIAVQAQDTQTINVGDQVVGTLSEETPREIYSFTLDGGTAVTITHESEDFDAYLILEDDDGNVIAEDDDSAGRLNSEIVQTLGRGTYNIIATSLREVRSEGALFASGQYVLSLAGPDGITNPVDLTQVDETPEVEETEEPVEEVDETDTTLNVGDAITGELTDDALRAEYTVSLEAGDVLSVTLVSEDFDPYIIILDPDGNVAVEDDDSAGNLNAMVDGFEATVAGDYTVVATSYGEALGFVPTTGEYTLTIDGGSAVVEVDQTDDDDDQDDDDTDTDADTVAVSESFEGTLTDDELETTYTFSANAGDVVTVSLTSEDFDTYLFLLDSDGNVVIEDDDGGDGFNSLIDGFEIPADGDYTIVATSYGQVRGFTPGIGDFVVTIDAGTAVVDADQTDDDDDQDDDDDTDTDSQTVDFGGTIEETLTDDALEYTVSFEATAGDIVSISMTSDDFDTYVTILDADGETVITDDDSGDGFNSLIEGFEIPETGDYTVVATSYGQARGFTPETGDFVLVIEAGTAVVTIDDDQDDDDDTDTVATDESFEGTLTDDELEATFTFSANEGDVVSISMTSEDIDTYLILLDPDGNEVARNDDGGDGLNSLIADFVIPATGEYTIVASSYGQVNGFTPDIGDFVVTITAGTPVVTTDPDPVIDGDAQPIAFGETIQGTLTEDATEALYTFSGNAGDIVAISVESVDFDTYLLLLDANGNILIEDDDSGDGINSTIAGYELPSTGDYTIVVTGYSQVNNLSTLDTGDFVLAFGEGTEVVVVDPDPDPVDPDPVQIDGEPIFGDLTFAEPFDEYFVQLSAGETVSASVESDDFDAYLLIADATQFVLFEDEDSGGGTNAAIVDWEAPFDGVYIVVVLTSGYYNGFDYGEGDYTLVIEGGTLVGDPNEITEGTTLNGTLTEQQPEIRYEFTAQAGDVLQASLTSPDFDTYILVEDSSGFVVTENDDGGEGLNSLISGYVIPFDGTYSIVVSSYLFQIASDPPGLGDFTLVVGGVEIGDPVVVTTDPVPEVIEVTGELEYDVTVSGSLSFDEPQDVYSFEANAGDVITITATSDEFVDGFDTYIFLLDEDGVEIDSDDDSAGSLDSRIGPFVVPATGEYLVIVDSYSNVEDGFAVSGAYEVVVELAVPEAITYGVTGTGTLDSDNSTAVYQFEGSAGDVITVDLTTAESALYVRLVGEAGNYLLGDGQGVNFVGPFTLPSDGTYTLMVASFGAVDSATFVVAVDDLQPVAIAYEEAVEANFDEGNVLFYTFEGAEADVVSIMVDSDGSVDTTLIVIDPVGNEIAFDDDGGAGFDPEINTLVLGQSGTYAVVVRPYINGDNGTFTLEVTNNALPSLDEGDQIVRLSDKESVGSVSFTGTAGESVLVSVELLVPSPVEPRIIVTQGTAELASNSVGQVTRLLIEVTPDEDGQVIVSVTGIGENNAIVNFSLEELAE